MNFFVRVFKRDPLTLFLGELAINNKNNRRCDLLNRSRLVSYFDLNDEFGREALLKVIELAGQPNTSTTMQIKIVMLLHALVLTSPRFYDFILDNEITLPEALMDIRPTAEKSIGSWLQQATVQYYNYVRRICLHKELYEQCKMRSTTPSDWSQCIQTIYMLMNLMRCAFPLKEFILHVGRYYYQDYLFVTDVNRMIAMDLCRLYNSISYLAEQLYQNYSGKLSRQQAQQLLNIVDEIYLLHEQLYVMLYNRYYFSVMDISNPFWFKLETRDYELLRDYALDRVRRRNLSLVDIDLNSFEETYLDGMSRSHRAQEVLPQL